MESLSYWSEVLARKESRTEDCRPRDPERDRPQRHKDAGETAEKALEDGARIAEERRGIELHEQEEPREIDRVRAHRGEHRPLERIVRELHRGHENGRVVDDGHD